MKLSNSTLANMPAHVRVPNYNRNQVGRKVVHIGPSHFFRAHIARYFDEILETDPSWSITAISLKSPEAKNALQDQDFLYSITETGPQGKETRIIGSLREIIVAPETPQAAMSALASPETELITITVTQDGYCIDPKTGKLDFNRADVDLKNLDEPSTVIGYLVAALQKRKDSGAPPLTIMSCDNMDRNGDVLKEAVIAFATAKSPALKRYIEANVTFPSTMVDRIVPSTQFQSKRIYPNRAIAGVIGIAEALDTMSSTAQPGSFRANFFGSAARKITTSFAPGKRIPITPDFGHAATGVNDSWPVKTEIHRDWVIENNFAGKMPDFASVGAIVADNVRPYEQMKLRMLNGAHMALCCIGRLAGYTYADEAMRDPAIEKFINNYLEETIQTLEPVEGIDFQEYKASLISRLQNPHMKDDLWRLGRNGTKKVSDRLLDTIVDSIEQDSDHQHLAFTTAAWIQYLKGANLQGETIDIVDQNAIDMGLQQTAQNSNGDPRPVMTASGLFNGFMDNERFIADVSRHLNNIQKTPNGDISIAINQIDQERAGGFALIQGGVQAPFVR